MIAMITALLVAQAASATPVPPPPVCDTPEHAAFDFWVGEWNVYPNGADQKVAESRIEKLYAGCAIRENWMPLKGAGGGSLNSLDLNTGLWRQTWVGSAPSRVEFTGGPTGEGHMVLTGHWQDLLGPGKDALVRMSYTLGPVSNFVREVI